MNADAMQMYEGAPIATNQPSAEELASVPHHLVGFQDPKRPLTVQEFVRLAVSAIADIHGRGRVAVVVGGTCYYVLALYFEDWIIDDGQEHQETEQHDDPSLSHADRLAQLRELDPVACARIDPGDERKIKRAWQLAHSGVLQSQRFAQQHTRPRFPERSLVVVLEAEGAEFEAGIDARAAAMVQRGLCAEAQALRLRWGSELPDCTRGVWQAIGLKELLGRAADDDDGAAAAVAQATRRYAKKQGRQLRNSLCPLLEHVALSAAVAAQAQAASQLAAWLAGVASLPAQAKLVPVARQHRRQELERRECCGKSLVGSAAIAQHMASRAHKRATKKKKRKIQE